ncbi:CGI-121-domain-containing protein [Bimuria novae-zelandiae CBS 107.79]|uniref:EKC/KEOPS complex subunit CGI121 n=1 Tax=Bimuria novae-zelandiae CBS 107.79 TaxID=1447943 RepID=A0A6A5UP58_9PLEO|nr:CGI-121-domain-containing protein [Bimuria novae-zelandiae CBS 107.79]
MASIYTLTIPHYPTHPIHIALFRSVRNAAHLRAQLLSANPSFDYAFLDATTILSYHQLLLAAQLALHAHLTGRSKTRTPHSELVFRLHPNNNIGESYRKFGINNASSTLIAIKFSLDPEITGESVARHLGEVVEGESVDIGPNGEELAMFADVAKIRKIFKLNDGGKGKEGAAVNGEARDERKQMESVILGTIALKGS